MPELPIIEFELPACPKCGSSNVSHRGGTVFRSNDLKIAYGLCRLCGSRWKAHFVRRLSLRNAESHALAASRRA